ncbi:MAG: DNA repair protein RecO [candidate division KSB1 bacterium]|jgi:DNA repair protein RecO (recombination protein O)|nr:DNA repair protein RecO [candidate division KSB1 bacterium]
MGLEKTEAIVLRSHKLGETSKILTLYSKKEGRLKVVAKGARGLKSRFYGSLESLNHINLVYYFKENRDLQLLSQADIIDPFNRIREDLNRFVMASTASEIVMKSQFAEEADPTLFGIFLHYLKCLNDTGDTGDGLTLWFGLQYLKRTGFEPKTDNCLLCGRHADQKSYLFSITRGGYVCDGCRTAEITGIRISRNSLELIGKLSNSGSEDASGEHASTLAVKESLSVTYQFMAYHVPGLEHLKSLDFREKLKL